MRNIIEATIESFPEFILKIKIEKMEKGIFVSVKISVREFHSGKFNPYASIEISASRKMQ